MENNGEDNKKLEKTQNLVNEDKTAVKDCKQKYKCFLKEKFNKTYLAQGIQNKWKCFTLFFVVIAVVLVLDLVLKSVFDGETAKFIEGFISIDGYAHNTGAAFSMFSNATTILLVLSILFVLAFLTFEFFTMDKKRGWLYYVAFSLIIGGTIGNLVDRLAFGYVRDFIRLEFMDFPIFNIADCALTVGVIILAVWIVLCDVKHNKKPSEKGEIQ